MKSNQNKESILVVDEDRQKVQAIMEVLETDGHACVGASTIAEARELLRTSDFELLIADAEILGDGDPSLLSTLDSLGANKPAIIALGGKARLAEYRSLELSTSHELTEICATGGTRWRSGDPTQNSSIYSAIRRIQEKLNLWPVELDGISDSNTIETHIVIGFITQTLHRIADTLVTLDKLIERAGNESEKRELRHSYRKVVEQAIETFDTTLKVLKAKDVEALRERLGKFKELD